MSDAILNQVSGEYRGDLRPADGQHRPPGAVLHPRSAQLLLHLERIGLRRVHRSGSPHATIAVAQPSTIRTSPGPAAEGARFKYNKLLPNIGVDLRFHAEFSAFANYTKGLSVPSTDNLYNSFFFPKDTEQAKPKPETTDSFDGGLRYRSSKIQAQLSGWYTKFTNRTASAFDPELNLSVFRNLGTVNKWGIDGSVAYEPIQAADLLRLRFVEQEQDPGQHPGRRSAEREPTSRQHRYDDERSRSAHAQLRLHQGQPRIGSAQIYLWPVGYGHFGPVDARHRGQATGPRFIFDNNVPMFRGDVDLAAAGGARAGLRSTTAPAYWLVNLDARLKLEPMSPALEQDLPPAQRL